jgi:hypothetical protein
MRIDSFIIDGIVVELGVVLDTTPNAMYFNLKEFDFVVSITIAMPQEI